MTLLKNLSISKKINASIFMIAALSLFAFTIHIQSASAVDIGTENTSELCHDGIDNNGNFLVDASDPSCSEFFPVVSLAPALVENTDALCHDGIDNNGNFLVDASDPDCSPFFPVVATSTVPGTENTNALCHDGIDNNGNFLIDASDPSCSEFFPAATSTATSTATTTPSLVENTSTLCHDGIDNNGNFLVDASDPDCSPFYTVSQSRPRLTIVKRTIGGNGTFQFFIRESETAAQLTTVGGYATSSDIFLNEGTSTVTELPALGWNFTGVSCIYDNESIGNSIAGGEEINVDNGDHVTCTFTNTSTTASSTGSIRVVKNVVGPDGSTDVSDAHPFNVTLNGTSTRSFSEVSDATYTDLAPGTYTIAELSDSNYDLVSISPDSDSETPGTQVTVQNGTTTVVTVINKQHAPAAPTPNNGGGSTGGGSGGSQTGGSTPQGGGSSLPTGGSVLGAFTSDTGGSSSISSTDGTTCTLYLSSYMKFGRKNIKLDVAKLQLFLNTDLGLKIPVSGFFGLQTESAVKQLQAKYSVMIMQPWVDAGITTDLTPTGYVYKTTLWFINTHSNNCAGKIPFPTLK